MNSPKSPAIRLEVYQPNGDHTLAIRRLQYLSVELRAFYPDTTTHDRVISDNGRPSLWGHNFIIVWSGGGFKILFPNYTRFVDVNKRQRDIIWRNKAMKIAEFIAEYRAVVNGGCVYTE
jgi:hypothetical protein